MYPLPINNILRPTMRLLSPLARKLFCRGYQATQFSSKNADTSATSSRQSGGSDIGHSTSEVVIDLN
jgi:hypothetical protein